METTPTAVAGGVARGMRKGGKRWRRMGELAWRPQRVQGQEEEVREEVDGIVRAARG